MIHEALTEWVKANGPMTALIVGRFYPFGSAPIGAPRPFMTYFIDDNLHVQHEGGPSGLANPRVKFDAWSDARLEAATVIDTLRKELDNFRGTMGTGGNAITIRKIVIDSDREDFVPSTDGRETGFYRSSADYLVWFVEEV